MEVDLIISVSNFRSYVRSSTKSFFDFDEIWYTGSTQWEMKKGNDHTRIQGQGQEPMKVGNSTIFKGYLHKGGAGKWSRVLKLGGTI